MVLQSEVDHWWHEIDAHDTSERDNSAKSIPETIDSDEDGDRSIISTVTGKERMHLLAITNHTNATKI